MAAAKDSFEELERHRKALEQNVDKLSLALDEWRQWKLEYEALAKPVNEMPSEALPAVLAQTRAAYSGDLVDRKVLDEIFGPDASRKRDQVASTISNRLDYVRRNIATLEKQLETAENKLAAANVLSNPDMPEDEEGLPITEIMEELDDDDNVVSYSLRTPGQNQSQLLETLKKAGLKELPSGQPGDSAVSSSSQPPTQTSQPIKSAPKPKQPAPAPAVKSAPHKPKPMKKNVTFSDDTKSTEEKPQYMSLSADKIDELMREAKEQEGIISDPVVPDDESDEEAQLRRDMLEYNLSELNPVVAELTLEEGGITDDDLDYSDYDDEDDDDEDQWGRSTSTFINEEYRQKMAEIQDRLNKHTFKSQQAASEDAAEDQVAQEGVGKIRIQSQGPSSNNESVGSQVVEIKEDSEPKPGSEAKKSVRFASALDIAKEPAAKPASAPSVQQPQHPEVDPLSDVIERKSGESAKSAVAPTKKASRFKMARSGNAPAPGSFNAPRSSDGSSILPEQPVSDQQFAPSGPKGATMATTVLERAPTSTTREPDEFDADMLKQQVAVEYHKVRNRMIQKQGGFMKEDESPMEPLDEEEGGPPRLSRFKAARLARS
ncbi:hypothetical protein JX265_012800 [Neoarthrinium moseri]|uniref:DUF3835 domain-containing protein n=1 Tax=Neoarthrinium moseri TaxID=1658444 RepID=A0A9Q0AIB6_9PEZI|nr:hypothetical protein JX266_005127 [Neoarthrinium moseri]KAI1853044.1 hypothetical protein JX265_012800 [Neoarthrinium moseri]